MHQPERLATLEQLVRDHCKGVNIDLAVVRLVAEDLRGHVAVAACLAGHVVPTAAGGAGDGAQAVAAAGTPLPILGGCSSHTVHASIRFSQLLTAPLAGVHGFAHRVFVLHDGQRPGQPKVGDLDDALLGRHLPGAGVVGDAAQHQVGRLQVPVHDDVLVVTVQVGHALRAVKRHGDGTAHRGKVVLGPLEQVRQGAARQVLCHDHVRLPFGAGSEETHGVRVVHLLQHVELSAEVSQPRFISLPQDFDCHRRAQPPGLVHGPKLALADLRPNLQSRRVDLPVGR
mmetsp:Transcript_11233/g.33719  ORF Transcript_11233/g.33719 Transcript_11233/m.33719 type:complete len:285 (+) Transcript_11233:916-1770(+)